MCRKFIGWYITIIISAMHHRSLAAAVLKESVVSLALAHPWFWGLRELQSPAMQQHVPWISGSGGGLQHPPHNVVRTGGNPLLLWPILLLLDVPMFTGCGLLLPTAQCGAEHFWFLSARLSTVLPDPRAPSLLLLLLLTEQLGARSLTPSHSLAQRLGAVTGRATQWT